MNLDETWQVAMRPEKTKPCTFPAKLHYKFRRQREKMGRRGVVFCQVNDAPLLPLSFDRFPPNFTWTRVQVVARDTWFHIPEQFPLRGRISRKTVVLGYKMVPCLCSAYGSREMFSVTPTLFPSPSGHPTDLSFVGAFCWGMYRFPAIHIRTSCCATVSAMAKRGCLYFFKTYSPGAQRSDRRFALAHYTSAHFLVQKRSVVLVVNEVVIRLPDLSKYGWGRVTDAAHVWLW